MTVQLDIELRKISQILKVPNCLCLAETGQKSIAENKTYFLCSCMPNEFYPICEACAAACHVNHVKFTKYDSKYKCMCGMRNHEVPNYEPNDVQKICLLGLFYSQTLNKQFFAIEYGDAKKIICSICAQKCHQDQYPEPCEGHACECEMHYDINILNMRNSFKEQGIDFYSNHLLNFNFNIFYSHPITGGKMIEAFQTTFGPCVTNGEIQESEVKSFFTNDLMKEIFKLRKKLTKSSVVSFIREDAIGGIPIESAMDIMGVSLKIGNFQGPSEVNNYVNGKISYAQFLFDYSIRSIISEKYNKINMSTFLNLNLLQRNLYLYTLNLDDQQEKLIKHFVSNFIKMTEGLFGLSEQVELHNFHSKVLMKVVQMCKYLMKYNLITPDERKTLFTFISNAVESSIRVHNGKSMQEGIDIIYYYVIKVIFFQLVYSNDMIVLQQRTPVQHEKNDKISYVFETSAETTLCSTIFAKCFGKLSILKDDLKRNLKLDLYIQKILELLVHTRSLNKVGPINNFYMKSLDNSIVYENSFFQDFSPDSKGQQCKIFIDEKVKRISDLSRSFFEFGMDHHKFYLEINKNLRDISVFLGEFLTEKIPLAENLIYYHDDREVKEDVKILGDENNVNNLRLLQNSVQHSTFFNEVNKILYFLSEKIKFVEHESKILLNDSVSKQHEESYLPDLLKFIVTSVVGNYQNLSMLMSISPTNFATVIGFNKSLFQAGLTEDIMNFIRFLTDMLFSLGVNPSPDKLNIHPDEMYEYDNFLFYFHFIKTFYTDITRFSLLANDAIARKYINIYALLFEIIANFIPHVSSAHPELFDLLTFSLSHIKDNVVNTKLADITRQFWNETINKNLMKEIENFWNHYFIMLNTILSSDLAYLDIFNFDKDFLLDSTRITEICTKAGNSNNETFPPLLISRVFECYLKMSMNFPTLKNNLSQTEQMINLLFTLSKKDAKSAYHLQDWNFTLINLTDGEILTTKDGGKSDEGKPGVKAEEDGSMYRYKKRMMDVNDKRNEILKTVCGYFMTYARSIISMSNISQAAKVSHILRYFEFNILNPIMIYINHFLLYDNSMKATASLILHQFVKEFIILSHSLYSTLNDMNYDIENMATDYHIRLNNINRILNQLNRMKKKIDLEINYYQLAKIVKCFRKTVKVICYTKDEFIEEDVNNYFKCIKAKGETFNKFKVCARTIYQSAEPRVGLISILDISNVYKERFRYAYESELALIDCLKTLSTTEIYNKLFFFAYTKLFDPLNYLNFKDEEIKEEMQTRLVFKSFRLRNLNYLSLLNNLLIHDDNFQKCILLELKQQVFKQFFYNFISYFIFNNILYNCSKIYELSDGEMPSQGITHQMLMEGILFLINMCNNQFKPFQDFLFMFNLTEYLNFNPPFFNMVAKEEKSSQDEQVEKHEEDVGEEDVPNKIFDADWDEHSLKNLERNRLAFFNILFSQLRILTKNFHFEHEHKVLFYNRINQNYSQYLTIYNQLFSLILAIIKGVSLKDNMKILYENWIQCVADSIDDHGDYYFFVKVLTGVQGLVGDQNIFDVPSTKVMLSIFEMLNNLLAQYDGSFYDECIVTISTTLFDLDNLMEVVSKYLRALYVYWVQNIKYDDETFLEYYQNLEMNKSTLDRLNKVFHDGSRGNLSEDDFFKLSSQIFLFIKILAEIANNEKAKAVLGLSRTLTEEESPITTTSDPEKKNKPWKTRVAPTDEKRRSGKSMILKAMYRLKKDVVINSSLNNQIVARDFFNNVVQRIDLFLPKGVDSLNPVEKEKKGQNEKEEKEKEKSDSSRSQCLQRVFFVVNQETFYISNDDFLAFLDQVDRSNPNTKLAGFLESIDNFRDQINYKKNFVKNYKNRTRLIDVNYRTIDKINLFIAVLVILAMFFHLQDDSAQDEPDFLAQFSTFYYIIFYPIAGFQILLNLFMFVVFYLSKFQYYGMKYDIHLCQGTLSYLKLAIIDCLFWTEDTFLMTLNMLIALISFFSRYFAFLYAVQLFTVVRFVPTIRQIAEAFSERFIQFSAMVGFLAILTNFYAMIGFYFMQGQFQMLMGDGSEENVCSSLLTCFILHFNHGVRTGGGVGDLLPDLPVKGAIYWLRYLSDFIYYLTVILLLLNMTSGIIVAAFGDIRTANDLKEDDKNFNCFICSISRDQFEENNMNFSDHCQSDHDVKTYLNYFIGVLLMNQKQLSSAERYVVDCIENKKIEIFPVGRVFGKEDIFRVKQGEEKSD